jgi:hypothetical protein
MMREAEDEPLFADRAAGIDIAKAGIEVTIRVPSDTRRGGRQQETRTFRTTRKDLLALADWLRCWQVTKVGMESTGVIRGSKAKNWTLRRSCRGRRVRGGEAKSAATRGESQMSATVGYLRRRRSCG